jgi:hypothetical protein
VPRGLSLSLSLSALAVSAMLAGCGAGSGSATESTHSRTVGGTSASVSRGARGPIGRRQPGAQQLTTEEMREYDTNEGRCHDDGASVRDVGTLEAYCSFPDRSNDFHLIETSHEKEPAGEEE